MYFVYILICCDGTYYCGCTSDVQKRVKEHNDGKRGARYTSSRRPVQLQYVETYQTKSEALKREYQIKQLSRVQKEKLFADIR